jgi:hypothetical protein
MDTAEMREELAYRTALVYQQRIGEDDMETVITVLMADLLILAAAYGDPEDMHRRAWWLYANE